MASASDEEANILFMPQGWNTVNPEERYAFTRSLYRIRKQYNPKLGFLQALFIEFEFGPHLPPILTFSGRTDLDLYGDDWGPWRYTGEVSDCKRHGFGKCTWHTHPGWGIAVYTGQWQSGRMCGEGELRRPNGNVYKGQLQAGKMHGRGKYMWATGRVYEGEWSEDKIEGRGKMTAADGSIEHDGWWENDEPVAEDPRL